MWEKKEEEEEEEGEGEEEEEEGEWEEEEEEEAWPQRAEHRVVPHRGRRSGSYRGRTALAGVAAVLRSPRAGDSVTAKLMHNLTLNL